MSSLLCSDQKQSDSLHHFVPYNHQQTQTNMRKLTLYYKTTCPYSQKVLHFLNECRIHPELKEISQNVSAAEELLKIGGKAQVPCLNIDGKALYESDAIIQWLTANAAD